ncbi:hypothetical protein GWO43_11525, partial [candidate division KSB1 bacterium]|nr:hypothetical protein [candidate division KSB1 bacterium]NIX71176.1 hypothetical protein [candidate division KSB1 bacterium]
MWTITELRLEKEEPDVIIRPDVHHFGFLDKVNVPEIVRLGEIATYEKLP